MHAMIRLHREAVGGLDQSGTSCMIGQTCIFGILQLTRSWK